MIQVTITRNYPDDTEEETSHTLQPQAVIDLCAKLLLEINDKQITSFVLVGA